MKNIVYRGLLVACVFVGTSFAQKVPMENSNVSAVAGESWLTHLGRSFDETSMGKTGRLGPPTPEPGWASLRPESLTGAVAHPVTLRGSDLYRLNCRGCHGESGRGAPPEINSVINPVRSTSTTAIMARMKAAGMEIGRADAAKLAEQSHALLIQRLHQGGQDMPAFPHLSEGEIHALVAYLKVLAEVPGAEREQSVVRESSLRVGEHIVKSTCHTCHSAAGSNPDAQELADGAIPPLSTLVDRVTEAQFVRKVTHGAPILMSAPAQLYRGRMPVFYYLSEEEAADAYLYLSQYPPYQWAVADAAMPAALPAVAGQRVVAADLSVAAAPIPASFAFHAEPARVPPSGEDGFAGIALISVAGILVTLLLVGGLAFTMRELKRLSANRLTCGSGQGRKAEFARAAAASGEASPQRVA